MYVIDLNCSSQDPRQEGSEAKGPILWIYLFKIESYKL